MPARPPASRSRPVRSPTTFHSKKVMGDFFDGSKLRATHTCAPRVCVFVYWKWGVKWAGAFPLSSSRSGISINGRAESFQPMTTTTKGFMIFIMGSSSVDDGGWLTAISNTQHPPILLASPSSHNARGVADAVRVCCALF